MTVVAAIILGILSLSLGVSGTQYYISPFGNDNNSGSSPQSAFLTLSKALDASVEGDTINAANGFYSGDLNVGLGITSRTIVGESPSGCVFQGSSGNSAMFTTYENASFKSLTLTGGYTALDLSTGTAHVENVIFSDLTFAIELGASTRTFAMTDCLVDHSTDYGLKYISSVSYAWENISVDKCKFYSSQFAVYIDATSTVNSSPFGLFSVTNSIATAPTYINWVFGADSTVFSGCEFLNSTAPNGGALYFEARSAFLVSNCLFSGNYAAHNGGAIYFYDSTAATSGSLTIYDSAFIGNVADTSAGGAVYTSGVVLNVTSSTFIDNAIRQSGGGAIYSADSHNPVATCNVVDSLFIGNTAKNRGAAISLGGTGVPASITSSSFLFNQAGSTGAVSLLSGDAAFSEVTFIGNVANENGGGLYIGSSSTASLANVSFLDNSAANGGAVYVDDGCTLTSSFTEMSNNTSSNDGGGLTMSSATVSMQFAAFYGNNAATGGGSYSEDNSSFNLIAALFKSNSAALAGGAFFCEGGGVNMEYAAIADNSSPVGSAYSCLDCSIHLTNSYIAKDNTVSGCVSDPAAAPEEDIEVFLASKLAGLPTMTVAEARQLRAAYGV